MKPRNPDNESLGELKADETREVTGDDAARDEADQGNVGADAGGQSDDIERHYTLEGDPGDPADIAPDKIERGFSDPDDEDRPVTARPDDEIRPITPDLLPSDDPGARKS